MTSDLVDWSVHGPVETLRTEFAEWDLGKEEWGPTKNFRLVRFLPGGRISVREHHNPDGSIARTTFHYDDAGRLSESRFQMDDGPVSKTVNVYDDSGRLIRSSTLDPDGTESESKIYRFDGSGRKIVVHVLPKQEGNRGYSYQLEGTDHAYSATGAATMTTVYDQREQPSEVLFHHAGGQLLQRVVMTRDREGRLEKEEMLFAHSPLLELETALENETPEDREAAVALLRKLFRLNKFAPSTTYTYDEKGRRVERRIRFGELSDECTTYRYDQHDNPIEETSAHASRDLRVDEQGNPKPTNERSHQQHSRFEYTYDAHGNWTERVVWNRLEPNPDFQRSNVERRVITYT